MKITQKQWSTTDVGRLLHIFPGFINHTLEHATPQQIIRAQYHLPLIFWRWYFLLMKSSHVDHNSPYFHAVWRREVEKWPSEGMFFPQAHLKVIDTAGKPGIQTEVTVDYILFHEQPLLVDLKRNTGHPSQLDYIYIKYRKDPYSPTLEQYRYENLSYTDRTFAYKARW